MIRSLFLVSLVALVGCSSGPPLAPQYRAAPSVQVPDAIAVAQPAAPTGDEALDEMLAELAAAIDRKDWRGVLFHFDPDAYAEQFALMSASDRDASSVAAQVLVETLGLSGVFTDGPSFEALDRVRVVTLRQVARLNDYPDAFYEVSGDVRLDGGETQPIRFQITRDEEAYRVLVPMG